MLLFDLWIAASCLLHDSIEDDEEKPQEYKATLPNISDYLQEMCVSSFGFHTAAQPQIQVLD